MISAFESEEVMSGLRRSHDSMAFWSSRSRKPLLMRTIASICGRVGRWCRRRVSTGTEERPARELAGRSVLVVEDNEINQDLAIELLGDLGIRVTIAANGREGVDQVASEGFDLVLMDIQMPVMDGLTATRLIRSKNASAAFPSSP